MVNIQRLPESLTELNRAEQKESELKNQNCQNTGVLETIMVFVLEVLRAILWCGNGYPPRFVSG